MTTKCKLVQYQFDITCSRLILVLAFVAVGDLVAVALDQGLHWPGYVATCSPLQWSSWSSDKRYEKPIA
jgi:hypothetical protein